MPQITISILISRLILVIGLNLLLDSVIDGVLHNGWQVGIIFLIIGCLACYWADNVNKP